MKQHRGADADREARDCRHDRLVGARQLIQESMSLEFGACSGGYRGKVGEVVPGGEGFTLCPEQHHASAVVRPRAFERVAHRPVHCVRQRIFLFRPREEDLQDGAILLDLDVLSHLSTSLCSLRPLQAQAC
jgi:hypothetical protein